jgi:O-antigen ligase
MISRLGGFLILLLVGTGLILLQIAVVGHGLLSALPSYALFGLAAIFAAIFWSPPKGTDRLCLASIAIFASWIVLRTLISPANYMARHDLYAILGAVALYGIIVTGLASPPRRFALILVLLVFALCHVVLGLVQFGHGENFILFSAMEALPVTNRAAGFYLNPDHLAGLLELLGAFALSVTCWSRLAKWARVVFGYLALTCYVGVALTASRGGYLSVVASLVVFGTLSLVALRAGGSSVVGKYGAIGALVLVGAFITPVLLLKQDPTLNKRLVEVVSTDQTRLDLWGAAIKQWKLNPLFGTGGGTYRYYGRLFRAERMQADPVMVHNDYLQLLCEYGLVGAGAFLFFCWAHFRYGWRNFWQFGPRRIAAGTAVASDRLALNIGAWSALGAYVMHSAVDFNMHNPPNAMIVAIALAFLASPGDRLDSRREAEARTARTGLFLGWVLGSLGFFLFFMAARLVPGEYYSERANFALENEHPAEAIRFAMRALDFEQRNPDIFFCLGRAEEALHDARAGDDSTALAHYQAALADFEQARRLAPLEEGYALDLGWLYDRLGRYPEAEWMFGVARKLDPNSTAIAALYRSHLVQWKTAAPTAAQ